MSDPLTIEERSRLMAKIKGKNTGPERAVRSMLHRAGFRFRIHVRALPGTPDIVLPRHRAVIFVHGCFWHRHAGCKMAGTPKSHRRFWSDKFARNVANDRKHRHRLRRLGWRVLTIWECQLKHPEGVLARIAAFLHAAPLAYVLPDSVPLPIAAEPPALYGRRPEPQAGASKHPRAASNRPAR